MASEADPPAVGHPDVSDDPDAAADPGIGRGGETSGGRSGSSRASGARGRDRRTRGVRDRDAEARARSRREGRRLALASTFEADFGQRTADAVLERHLALEADEQAAGLAREIVTNLRAHRAELDARIGAVAPQYPVVQLARMDRALLRCGLCEMLHSPATPARVAIAEWVELARIYSGEPMRRLMNGVLGRVARDMDATR
jgi:N utilization substance protein B